MQFAQVGSKSNILLDQVKITAPHGTKLLIFAPTLRHSLLFFHFTGLHPKGTYTYSGTSRP